MIFRQSVDPPWYWKPWLRPWFAIQDWWQRPRAVKVRMLSPEEGRALFDRRCREELGISGAEFLRRWDSGYYESDGDGGYLAAGSCAMLIPFGR